MSRRTFERRSRAQNQTEITRLRDKFFGEVSDFPGNAIDKKYQAALVNQVCYGSFIKTRDGITSGDMPPLPFCDYPGTWFMFSQNAYTVTSSNYTFSSADVGKYICYDNSDGALSNGYLSVKIVAVGVGTASNTCTVDLYIGATSRIGSLKSLLNGLWYNSFSDVYIAHIGNSLYYPGGNSSWITLNNVGTASIPNCKSIIRDNDNLIVCLPQGDPNAVIVQKAGVWIIDVPSGQYWQAASNDVDAPIKSCPDAPIVNGYNRRYLYTKSRFVGDSSNWPIFANRNLSTDNDIQHESGATQLGPNISDTDYTTLGTATANGQLYGQLTFYPTLSYFTAGNTYAFALAENGQAEKQILFTLAATTPVTIDSLMSSFASVITTYFPDIVVQDHNTNSNVPVGAIILTTTTNYLSYFTAPTVTDVHDSGYLNGTTTDIVPAVLSDYVTGAGTQTNGQLLMTPNMGNFQAGGSYVFGLPVQLNGVAWTLKSPGAKLNSNSMCYGNGLYVAVGNGGTVQTSSDNGTTWVTQTSGTGNNLFYVCYYSYMGTQKFVAVGASGIIITSDSTASTWSTKTSNTANDLNGVAQGATGELVAVGGRDIVKSANAGATWSKTTVNSCAITCRDGSNIAGWSSGDKTSYGSILYVIVGPCGLIQTSTDESSWTLRTSNTTNNLNAVSWGYSLPASGSSFCVCGDNGTILNSLDGITWTQQVSNTSVNLHGMSLLVSTSISGIIVGDSGTILYIDSTFTSWQGRFSGTSKNLYSIAGFLNTTNGHWTWVAVGHGGDAIFTSQSIYGTTWISLETHSPVHGINFNSIAVSPKGPSPAYDGAYVVVGDLATIITANNSSLTSWTPRSSGPNNLSQVMSTGTDYTNSGWLAVGGAGTVFTSSDFNGTTWAVKSTGLTDNIVSVSFCYTGSEYVISTDAGLMYESTNLTSWTTKAPAGFAGSFRAIIYNAIQYVISGDIGTFLTSADAVTWSKHFSGIPTTIRALTYGNSLYLAVGDGGMVYSSSDAISWASQTSNTVNKLYSVTYGNGLFRAAGVSGMIISSSDGVNWNIEASGTTYDITAMIFTNSTSDFAGSGLGAFFLISGPIWVTLTVAFVMSDETPSIDSLISSFASVILAAYPEITVTAVGTTQIQISTLQHQLNYLVSVPVDDIHGYGKLNADSSGSGAQLVALTSPAAKYFNQNLPESSVGPHTHYTVYATEDLNTGDVLTVGNDPNAFALLDDIPIMKAFYGDGATSGLLVNADFSATFTTAQGQFSNADIGRIMPIVWLNSGNYYLVWGKILAITSPTVAQVKLTTNGTASYAYSGPIGSLVKAWATIESVFILDCSLSYNTITINHIWYTSSLLTGGGPLESLTLLGDSNGIFPLQGEQCFLSYGDIRVVVAVDSGTITVDENMVAYSNATIAFRAMDWSYLDSYTDDEISPKIGQYGCKTRFMRSIPWDTVHVFIGEMVPGFLVCGSGVNYQYSELPNNYRFLIGDYNPNQQADKTLEPITCFSNHADGIGIFSKKSAYAVQTNLDIEYTDTSNGMVVRTLPPPKLIGENNGCNGPAELCHVDDGTFAVILAKTGDICIFDGSSFGSSLVLGKIRNKINGLYNRTIDYDYQYGLLIRGNSWAETCHENNKMYYVTLPECFAVGQGEFQYVPLGEQGVHFIRNLGYTFMYNALIISSSNNNSPLVRSVPGEFFRFAKGTTLDSFETHCFALPISSSQTTSDDIGTSQAFFIENMEGHLFLTPDGTDIDPNPVTGQLFNLGLVVSVTGMNDIGQIVTTSSSVSNNDDINFDTKVRGHRIRYTIAFNQAGWIMTGFLNYYKSSDKRTPTNSASVEQAFQNIIMNPVLGISRSSILLNIATGLPLVGSVTRSPGPDGLSGSAIVGTAAPLGIEIPCPLISPCDFTLIYWYKTGGLSTAVSILGQYSSPGTIVLFWRSATSQLVFLGTVVKRLINDGAWHFVKMSYATITNTVLVSEDLGADVATVTNLPDGFLASTMTILANTSTGELFDVRLFGTVLSNSDLEYYYNDVLSGGNKTLVQQ